MDELAKGLTDQPCPSQTTENALTRPESDYLGDKSATRNVIEPTNFLFHKIIGSDNSNIWRAHHLTLFHIFIILYIRRVVPKHQLRRQHERKGVPITKPVQSQTNSNTLRATIPFGGEKKIRKNTCCLSGHNVGMANKPVAALLVFQVLRP